MPLRCVYFGHRASQSFIQRSPTTFAMHSACRRCGVPLVRVKGKWKVESESGDEQDAELERPAA